MEAAPLKLTRKREHNNVLLVRQIYQITYIESVACKPYFSIKNNFVCRFENVVSPLNYYRRMPPSLLFCCCRTPPSHPSIDQLSSHARIDTLSPFFMDDIVCVNGRGSAPHSSYSLCFLKTSILIFLFIFLFKDSQYLIFPLKQDELNY